MNIKKFLHKFSFTQTELESLASSLVVRTALVTAIVMPSVRAIHDVQAVVLTGVTDTVKVTTEKLALAFYEVLRAVTINSFTQSIFPSVRYLDHDIKKACTTFSQFLGTIFIQLTSLAFCLFAICTPLACAALGAVVIPVAKFIDNTVCVLMETYQTNPCAKLSQTENVQLSAKILSNVAAIATHAAYAILSLLCIPFMIPAYVFGSTFGLANKFNIYDYNKEHSSGIVHKHIKDVRNCTTFIPLDDKVLCQEAHHGHPSMYAQWKLADTDSDKPGNIIGSGISISIYKYEAVTQAQPSAQGR